MKWGQHSSVVCITNLCNILYHGSFLTKKVLMAWTDIADIDFFVEILEFNILPTDVPSLYTITVYKFQSFFSLHFLCSLTFYVSFSYWNRQFNELYPVRTRGFVSGIMFQFSSVVISDAETSKQIVLSIPYYLVQLCMSASTTLSTILSLSLNFVLINFIGT